MLSRWTYEWCHRRGVRQFHREQSGEVTADFSMGTFDQLHSESANSELRSVMRMSATEWRDHAAKTPEPFAPVYKFSPVRSPYYSHVFVDGQPCDELGGQGRQTEVRFKCCSVAQGASVQSIDEPGICRYVMSVCAPSLCLPEDPPEEVAKPQTLGQDLVMDSASSEPGSGDASGSPVEATSAAPDKTPSSVPAAERPKSSAQQFYGLLWNRVVYEDSSDLWWVNTATPVTSLSK